MDGKRLEYRRLLLVEKMLQSGLGDLDAARESDLAPARIAVHGAAGRDGRHLQPPAAAEHRRLRAINAARELDLRLDGRTAVINMQCGAGDGDAVVALKARAIGQVGARVGRKTDIDDGFRPKPSKEPGVALACRHSSRGDLTLTPCGGISFDNKQTGARHGSLRSWGGGPRAAPGRGRARSRTQPLAQRLERHV